MQSTKLRASQFPWGFLKFSRGFESEADMLGLQYMYKAGYDPNSFVDFFEKIESLEKKKPGSLSKVFSTPYGQIIHAA
jgi:predicted Zn-dependent protease